MAIITGNDQDNMLQGYDDHDTIYGLGGDDFISGGAGNDTLVGGRGNDRLDGNGGNNTYVFDRGDGQDTIMSFDPSVSKFNVLAFGEHIAPSDVIVSRINGDLVLQLLGGTDKITIVNYFGVMQGGPSGSSRPWAIEQITFATGEAWDERSIALKLLPPEMLLSDGNDFYHGVHANGLGGDDELFASESAILHGGSGNDRIQSGYGDDRLDGGAGNDIIGAGGGLNTITFARGDGNDRILLDGGAASGFTQLQITDMLAADFAFAKVPSSSYGGGHDLVLSSKTGSDSITIVNYFDYSNYYGSNPFVIVFAGGPAMSAQDVDGLLNRPPGHILEGTEAGDTLMGSYDNDVLWGKGGDDTLHGNDGDDLLVGGDGIDWLNGGYGNDSIQPGVGDADLEQGAGNNMLVVGREAGTYRVLDFGSERTLTIAFARDIQPGQLRVTMSQGQASIAVDGTMAKVVFPDFVLLDPYLTAAVRVVFSDGTVWNSSMLRNAAFNGTELPDVMYGTQMADLMRGNDGADQLMGHGGNDALYGGNGNDMLDGFDGDDKLYGGAGDDHLMGGPGDDVLAGGSGHDLLFGGEGSATYRYNPGDGWDVIELPQSGPYWQPASLHTVVFGEGISPAGISVALANGTSTLMLRTGGPDQAVVINNFNMSDSASAAVEVRFADGTVWNQAQLRAQLLVGTEDGDTLYGFETDDLMSGKGGNDMLRGGGGNDTMLGGMGDDLIFGDHGHDTIEGGAGADELVGDMGRDIYVFHKGDGSDILYDYSAAPEERSVLRFGEGINPAELILQHDGSVLTVRYGLGDQVRFNNFHIDPATGQQLISHFEFADGTTRTFNELFYHPVQVGTPIDAPPAAEGKQYFWGIPAGAFTDKDPVDTNFDYELAMADGSPVPAWVQFHSSGAFTGTPGQADSGLLAFRLTAIDRQGHRATTTFSLKVENTNAAPAVVSGVADMAVAENAAFSNAVPVFADPDGQPLTVSLALASGEPLPSWMSYNAATGMLEGQPGFDASGVYAISATASDGELKTSSNFNVVVADTNRAPQPGAPAADAAATEGAAFSAAIPQFSDPDGTVLAVSLTLANGEPLPAWMAFNAATGLLQGTPTYADSGSYAIKATASDGSLSASSVFTLTVADVNRAPVVGAAAPDAAVAEGAAFEAPAPSFIDPDTGHMLTVTLTLADGSPLPAWLSFDPALDRLFGTPTFDSAGSYALKAIATDAGGLSAASSFSLAVANTNRAPVLAQAVADQGATEGAAFALALPNAMFTDPDSGDGGTLSVSGMPSWMGFNSASRTFSGTPGAADVAASAITVTWTDAGGAAASDIFSVTVAQAPSMTINGTALADTLTGKSNNDTLSGLAGDDVLDGGLGADLMKGGLGNDTFHVDNAGDSVVELGGEGTDTVVSLIGYTLGASVEKLVLGGSASINGTGNVQNNTLTGNAGANVLDGGAGGDAMAGGDGNDTYVVDNTSDTITEASASGGFDRVISSVGRSLGAHQEALTLSGTGPIVGYGNALANVVQGNDGANSITGGEGGDILQGKGGDDSMNDTSAAGNLFDGGLGLDRLSGGAGADMFIGGAGNDIITTGAGKDIIAFNRGDGADTVNVTSGSDNTLSLGRGVGYADLMLSKAGNDLVLTVGAGEQLTFKGWYSSTNARSVATLQVVTEGGSDYVAGSASVINDHKVELFDFVGLVAKFDAARALTPGLQSWGMASSLALYSTGGSDTAAIGGDLAYQYALGGSLSALSAAPALSIIGSPSFGAGAQTLLTGSALNDGLVVLY